MLLSNYITNFKPRKTALFFLILTIMVSQGCGSNNQEVTTEQSSSARLIVLDPGHFHAALLQKSANSDVDSTVHVFAPDGPDVKAHLALIEGYNTRADEPTSWKEEVYTGADYFEKMLATKPGNVVVIAGNNKMKTDYIKRSVEAGLNVLADKPMAINKAGFNKLKEAFDDAKKNNVLLYDIMTERYEITSILQKTLSKMPDVFGELQKGTPEQPAVSMVSTHHFFKEVSGKPLVRPAWYLDVEQEGEGLVDVTTHMVDMIQWECFSEEQLDYTKDIQVLSAKRWPTLLTPAQFTQITKNVDYPDFLKKDVKDSVLNVYANGQMTYTIKGVHASVSVEWKFQAPEGSGDSFYSIVRGTKANLVIRQSKEQNYKPILYIEPVSKGNTDDWKKSIQTALSSIQKEYPGVDVKESKDGWEVVIPDTYKVGHEHHFSSVFKKYTQFLKEGKMPEWEISFMLAKYYTTTEALEKAMNSGSK